jgi:ATP-dependent protease ClpP protease subunit
MPTFNEIVNEANATGSGSDVVRRKYIRELHNLTGRNVIVYYSGWLQKPIPELMPFLQVNDNDKNGFMATIHQLDRSLGLDLVLHTPGGEAAATESLVQYLRQMFGNDIRAIIPQLAMSAGTMIALACKEIVMGKESNLGPIDPQIGTLAAHGVIDEFQRAAQEIQGAKDPKEQAAKIAVWQPIIAKYTPTMIGECQYAITWATDIVTGWLKTGMFDGDPEAEKKAKKVVNELGSHAVTKTHARHIHADRLRELGVKVAALEDDQKLQDAVLTVHHACTHTLMLTPAVKIIENQNSVSFIIAAQIVQRPAP